MRNGGWISVTWGLMEEVRRERRVAKAGGFPLDFPPGLDSLGRMRPGEVKQYYQQAGVVDHYASATDRIGLWVSETKVFQGLFKPEDSILELGCGTGRIAFGLYSLGYRKVFATDVSRKMVGRGRAMAATLGMDIAFGVQDARSLTFGDAVFDGAIFAFNGLMQIPGRENRRQALREIARVLRPGAWIVFTAHDREADKRQSYWKEERKLWRRGRQDERLDDFGDVIGDTPFGEMFIHVPVREEIHEDLRVAGLELEVDVLRSQLANESAEVRQFSDECRFYIARKPESAEEAT